MARSINILDRNAIFVLQVNFYTSENFLNRRPLNNYQFVLLHGSVTYVISHDSLAGLLLVKKLYGRPRECHNKLSPFPCI